MKSLDRFQGCLLGGAVGDALGYAVEFMLWEEIQQRYGRDGIQQLALCGGSALISDDTQMTLFTANGLLLGDARGKCRGISAPPESDVWLAYQEWLGTQGDKSRMSFPPKTWLYHIRQLHAQRAPGDTCLCALQEHETGGTPERPINDSKGCGGLMRVAPVGMFFDPQKLDGLHGEAEKQAYIGRMGAKVAALTHGHPLGYLPAAAMAHLISRILYGEEASPSLEGLVLEAAEAAAALFPGTPHAQAFLRLMQEAAALSRMDLEDPLAIHRLGQGWVAEETLAISVYSALKYQDDFRRALCCAVNHDGDSDSTGAVTGNLLGAWLGRGHIEGAMDLSGLELKGVILEMAGDLFTGCRMSEFSPAEGIRWHEKYSNPSGDGSWREDVETDD